MALVREGYLAPDNRLLDELHELLLQTLANAKRHGSQDAVKQSILVSFGSAHDAETPSTASSSRSRSRPELLR